MVTDQKWTRELLEQCLPEYGYQERGEALDRLTAYGTLVMEWNARVRLVGSADPQTLARRHLGESLYLGAVLRLERQRVVDVGSGAGFPGLALALGWSELNTTLVESTGKKAAFLRTAALKLGVEARVQVWDQFVERRPTGAEHPLHHAELVTVRALEKMDEVPKWLGGWLKPEAEAAFWLGERMAEEWRMRYAGWRWSEFHRLPGSRERGILLGQRPLVSRGT